MTTTRPRLGHGIGLRTDHFAGFLSGLPQVDWVEAISENFMAPGGRPIAVLEKVRAELPVVLHGVSLAIGSVDPIPERYLAGLRQLVDRIQPDLVSDHLCWGTHRGHYLHDLLPLPYTEESLAHVASRVRQVQDFLGRQLLLENPSSYVAFKDSTLPEWEFLSELSRRSGCGILLDVNNVYVSARNFGFDPLRYLDGIPAERVGYLHLAGHTDKGTYLLDSHAGAVPPPVWALYREALRRFGPVPSLVEWDEEIPALDAVVAERHRAAAIEAEELALAAPEARLMTLAETQALFHEAITAPDPLPRGRLEACFAGTPGLPAADRVAIYADMYRWRLVDGLRQTFPSLAGLLGHERFAGLAGDYLRRHPSEHHDISRVGRHLVAFLRQHPDPERPDLADLAALEWARQEVFFEAPAAAAGPEAFAGLSPEAFSMTGLELAPALRLLLLDHPVTLLWRRIEDGEAPDAPAPGTSAVAVWRRGFEVFHGPIALDEAEALGRARSGAPLATVCAAFTGRDDPAGAAHQALSSWLVEGWILGLRALRQGSPPVHRAPRR